ncbi:carboxylic ester hydrolase-like [Bicyclus anynana]|uniref:Carboxylic ester hydrolase-like n=1 Tax=Bicyclus anynana TaxID=110368 RepID=A0ABM3LEY5_BICAN|nr:carboxylic ester hydrolase-like [Bicyclus anynana]
MAVKILWSFVIICGVLCENYISEPKVRILQGTVVGSTTKEGYYKFSGIPFADSTSGINRFKAPSPPPTFRSEFISNREDVKCVRPMGDGYEGTEDCLAVDIMTPTLDRTKKLPVMVWIRGTEFNSRDDLDQSLRFVEKDVIVARIPYRESILGFLCLGTENAPGNAGLKDIIAGLKWIQENIERFGGDPDNVTLVGHGSGASAVDLITLSPLAEGLVHKVISQSGTALSPWAVTRNNLRYAIEVAEALGHTVTTIEQLSDVLTQASTAALMAVINKLDLTDNSLAFAPCIEKEIENVTPLMLKSPYEIITNGEQIQIPFMTGFVDFEGTIRINEGINKDWLERMDDSFTDFLQSDIGFESIEQEEETAEKIRTAYFGNGPVNESLFNNFLKYNGDTMILVSAIREARFRALLSDSDVYLYQFSYRGSRSEEVLSRPIEISSAGHLEELVYMFSNELTGLDLTIGNLLVERWTNFAKTGIPTSETSQVEWLPYYPNSTHSNFLRISDDEEILTSEDAYFDANWRNPQPTTMAFWDEIYSQFFVDAKSRFTMKSRNDTGEDDPEPGEDDNDSASTAVGYTFLIISLFAVLDKFHNSQILS